MQPVGAEHHGVRAVTGTRGALARSVEPVSRADLRRLARLALEERDDFFHRHPEWSALYRRRVIASALCGDAALHFVNGASGFTEFEVWTFYAEHPEAPFPHHRVSHRDFGPSRFGCAPGQDAYLGRRVILTGRSIGCASGEDAVAAVQVHLQRGQTPSARSLRRKAVVMIEPKPCLALVVWPTLVVSPSS